MRKMSIAASCAILCTVIVTLYAVHLASLREQALCVPHTVTADFSTNGLVWKRRALSLIESRHVSADSLTPEQFAAMDSFVRKKYGASSLSSYCARSLAMLAVEEKKSIHPLLRAVDQLTLASLLYVSIDEKSLAEAYLNRKTVLNRLAGIGILSETVYAKNTGGLSSSELISLFRFYCAPSSKNIDTDAYRRIASRAALLSVNESAFAGTPADFCEKELRREGIWPPRESIIIETTIDPRRQKFLERTAVRCLKDLEGQPPHRKAALRKLPPVEGAAVIIDIRTGGVLAMAGSVEYAGKSPLNRCESRRQISSTFKPFLYAQAFEDGVCTPSTVFVDKPVTLHNSDGTPWQPKNFYPYYIGEVTAGNALSLSINTVSVQLIETVGIGKMASRAADIFSLPDSRMSSRIESEPSLALGSIDLSPLELAKGYLTIASLGIETVPHAVSSVKTADGRIIWNRKPQLQQRRLFTEKTCRTIIPVLQNVIRTGTASKFIRKKLDFDAAGKSGSSPSDSWFAGFTPETLIVTWAGYDIPSRSSEGKLPEFTVIPFWYELAAAKRPSRTEF